MHTNKAENNLQEIKLQYELIHRMIKSPDAGFDGAVSTRLHRSRVKSEVHKPHCINEQTIRILYKAE